MDNPEKFHFIINKRNHDFVGSKSHALSYLHRSPDLVLLIAVNKFNNHLQEEYTI
jgi:hypothetical protein